MAGILSPLKHVVKAYFAGCFGCLGVISAMLALVIAGSIIAGPEAVMTLAGTTFSIVQNLARPPDAAQLGGAQQQQAPMQGLPVLKADYSPSSTGETLLRVKVVGPGGAPIARLEVDLWTAPPTGGPPTAGVQLTNSEGVAQFGVLPGEYAVGFNMKAFPPDLVFPRQMWTAVANPAQVAETVIRLEAKR